MMLQLLHSLFLFLCTAAVFPRSSIAYELDVNNPASIKSIAKNIASKIYNDFYPKNNPPENIGVFAPPDQGGYYWWEAGAVWGAMVDYWHFTGDTTYVNITTQSLLAQRGENNDYNPLRRSHEMGNDDQAFWAFSALTAAERKFPDPPADMPGWIPLAETAWVSQMIKWDTTTCGGGLRWQKFELNKGYGYKNSVSNGAFFLMGARLARYTKNETKAEWAGKVWDWTQDVGFLTPEWEILDGAGADNGHNCTNMDRNQRWSYNAGIYLAGAATMYNYTNGAEIWKTRVDNLLSNVFKFFFHPDNLIMFEPICEPYWGGQACNTDQKSFKAYLARFLTTTREMAPYTAPLIRDRLRLSAVAAAAHCSNLADQNTCGLRWYSPEPAGNTSVGLGEQLAALEVVQSMMTDHGAKPAVDKNEGTSESDPDAGTKPLIKLDLYDRPTTTGDKVGAGILTAFVIIVFSGLTYWLVAP